MRTMLKVGNKSRSMLIATVALAVMITGLPEARAAENIDAAKTVINDALSAFNNFMQDPDSAGFRENLKEAKGLLIVPSLMKGAFLFGVEGGNGVLLVRDEKTGSWSEPCLSRNILSQFRPAGGGAAGRVDSCRSDGQGYRKPLEQHREAWRWSVGCHGLAGRRN